MHSSFAFRSFARCVPLWLVAIAVSLAAESATPAPGLPFLSPIFGDSMVLQRGKPNTLWGWTEPGQPVRVSVNGKTGETRAGTDGKWRAVVEVPPAGGPYEVAIDGPQHVVLHDVLVGDVWLCGGQSNMGIPLRGALGGADEAKAADHPQLRFYTVGTRSAYAPTEVPKGQWRVCKPDTAAGFSAVAYFFGRRIQRELNIPIGLIQDNLGGSRAESWMSAASVASTGDFNPQLAEIARLHATGAPELGSFLMHWLDENDAGGKGEAWAKPDFDDRQWKPVELPGAFADLGVPATPSVCWFRRVVDLPDPLPAGNARVQLGQVEKMETTYVNGRWIGASSWVENPRNYGVPAGVLHPGKNVIAVRVFKNRPNGGFIDGAKALKLQFGPPDTGTTIPLDGKWLGQVSVDARPPHPLPLDRENYPTMPVVLYDGMIAPLAPLALAGAIWYQGEANSDFPAQYHQLLPALIASWRDTFQDPHLPFYIAGLPFFQARRDTPGGSDGWAEIREAQAATVRQVPDTGLAVTIDTGDANNIHPTEKQPVGERLAACALAQHYGVKLPHEGPSFRALEPAPGALRLHFAHTDGGLMVKGDKLGEFSVAGEDHVWHWAQAKIEGDSVVVSSPDVANPVAARYAWQSNPLATLFNGAGFPAVPFRTDDWPLRSAP